MNAGFVCPACGADCPTLGALLTCHPRALRAATTALHRERTACTIDELLTPRRGHMFPPAVRAALADAGAPLFSPIFPDSEGEPAPSSPATNRAPVERRAAS